MRNMKEHDLCANAPKTRNIVLAEEDAKFLEDLRQELLTQPTDGNRDPRFWGVIEDYREWGYDSECADGWGVFDDSWNMCCNVGEVDDLQSVLNELTDPNSYGFAKEDFTGCTTPEDVVEQANHQLGKDDPFSVSYYQTQRKVSEKHIFLTKKACNAYIKQYGYNHTRPSTYVMTAERCPEYERLLKILKTTQWSEEGKE